MTEEDSEREASRSLLVEDIREVLIKAVIEVVIVADEMIEVLHALWKGGMVEHHGRFFDFPALQIAPAPTKPVPIWMGGSSEPALRRTAWRFVNVDPRFPDPAAQLAGRSGFRRRLWPSPPSSSGAASSATQHSLADRD